MYASLMKICLLCPCTLLFQMHNTEQTLKSVGLLACKLCSLQECHDELSKVWPGELQTRPDHSRITTWRTNSSLLKQHFFCFFFRSVTQYHMLLAIYRKCIFMCMEHCLQRLKAVLKMACLN